MSVNLHRVGWMFGVVAAAFVLASPALVHAEPHLGGGRRGAAHVGRARGHVFMGHGFARPAGRGGAFHGRPAPRHPAFGRMAPARAGLGRDFGTRTFISGGGPRHFIGDGDAGRDHRRRFGAVDEGRLRSPRGDGGYDRDHRWRTGEWRGDHHWDWDDHPDWGGGWWGGSYWPRAYYGWDYPWLITVLPAGVVTYWWGGIPYYYVNSVYYVWDSADDGYVVANPPPVAQSGQSWYSDPPAANSASSSAPSPSQRGPDDVYMYPKKGQSKQQQATDRYQCHKWAEKQSGFDPTRPASASSGSGADYHRALVACLTGRGYSVD